MDPAPDHWHVVGDGAIGMAAPIDCTGEDDRSPSSPTRTTVGPGAVVPFAAWPGGPLAPDVLARPDGRLLERVLVTTKAYSVEEVFATWGEALAGHASIYYLQSGLDFEARGLPGRCACCTWSTGGSPHSWTAREAWCSRP